MLVDRIFRHLKLGAKFNLLTITLILVTAVVVGGYLVKSGIEQRRNAMEVYGRSIISIIAQNSEYALYTEDQSALQQLVENLIRDPDVAYVTVYSSEKLVLLARSGVAFHPPTAFPFVEFKRGEPPLATKIRDASGTLSYLDLISPVYSLPDDDISGLFPGENHVDSPLGYVRIGLTYAHLNEAILTLVVRTLLFTLGVVIVGIILTLIVSRKIVAPIQRFATIAHKISQGDLDQVVVVRSGDEIAGLGESFNKMLEELRQYRDRTAADRHSLEEKVEQRTAGLKRANEQAMNLARQAEEASKAKSRFLANMSHEIRTPMSGILGMAELLSNTELTDKQRNYLGNVQSSAEGLLKIINDILDFSKIEAGKLTLEKVDLSLEGVIAEVFDLFNESAARKGLELKRQIGGDIPAMVKGDPVRLRQILINLIGNSIKFTEAGGVTLDVFVVESIGNRLLVRFVVKDTGPGIPPHLGDRIFSSFSQADQSDSRKFGGTGLGLAIARDLAEMMGGEIGYTSEVGKGSQFWFTASLEKGEKRGQPHAGQLPVRSRVLLVHGDVSFRENFEVSITGWGLVPLLASSGKDALETLLSSRDEGGPVDLVILESILPDIRGIDLARKIRDVSSTPVVMINGLEDYGDRAETEGLGIVYFLKKPVGNSELHSCLVALLGRSAPSAALTATAPPPSTSADSFSGHVLLVEDNIINQEVAQEILEFLGVKVTAVKNGEEGIREYAASQFDLIFMDCQMPVMDGYEASRKIRETESLSGEKQRIPIIALTAHTMEGDKERCLEAGMDDFLSKPFSQEQLASLLGRWLPQSGKWKS